MGEMILRVEGLKKVYPDGTVGIKEINTSIRRGELISVIGPSGAGKSTFLRSINRLVEPTSGAIFVEGENICNARGKKLRQMRRKIGMVFQHYNLIKRSSVLQNVLHGRLGYMSTIKGGLGRFHESDTKRALSILKRVGLEEQAFKRADELSGGQQQRVGIARAIAQNPTLILADEPIASLDPTASENVLHYMKTICQEEGITTVVNLHQVEFAKKFADRMIGIKAGEIVFDGTPRELTDYTVDQLYQ
ncbi:phosphonate ABC transporter ATP-binding protein [Halalkalibacterium halodurans]|jgi:phosphonate transport system ATP-binding protein|uniref:Phosphonate ABC transporter ATP-binding protein n=1 Tax=Halalkalibacterium halodurans TaxID=86665 RepID=A0A0M0KF01_ALKHA|nr:phosphonate ABC transporter ATP-binding protein [Halalkalibacterium halodurans]MED3645424.1 phosphonate ABC transporter ATP-binding protein [Halalkalibacterium halodurans]MED4164507.1 phosphonate ABC transporter ATP-binding protein [Halalkalibacterium halodurans]TES52089.1 phosphonate ABC transporter ATP-binding protein [Halalkalibacterium halodurans]TPE69782.1 phosphonate ABC transporter ATP-binding protein [Halalkalibacterium halodurans]